MKQTRRSVLRSIGAGTAVAVGGVGAASAAPPSDGDTIVDVAVAADGFDVLVAAVREAGLVDTLSGNRQLTVFAPTDEAFGNLLEELGITQEELLARDDLAEILTYHVAPGERDSESVLDAEQIPTLNGARIDVDGTTLDEGSEFEAELITEAINIEASNGFIHAIDGVLMP